MSLQHLAVPLLQHPSLAVPLEADETELASGERDQAWVEKGGPLPIGAEELQERDAAAFAGAVGKVQVTCGSMPLTIWRPEGSTLPTKPNPNLQTV